jgi:site-specific recombinase XerC
MHVVRQRSLTVLEDGVRFPPHRTARHHGLQADRQAASGSDSGLFDYLTIGGILDVNPASAVRGPKYMVRCGKTPCCPAEEARKLLESIESNTIGLRDRALIGTS